MVVASSLTLIAGLALASIQAQGRTNETAEPKRGDTVIVRGCINGRTMQSSETETRDGGGKYFGRVKYRLTGEKKTLQRLKDEHQDHADVLIGVLKSDLPHQDRGTRIGNTRVVVGLGDPSKTDPRAPEYLPTLQVQEIEHTGVSCGR